MDTQKTKIYTGAVQTGAIPKSLDAASTSMRRRLILFSPLAVILLGQLAARTLGPALGVWSWAPLTAPMASIF